MPRRTNDFQQLVQMIHQAFAPTGAKVTESALDENTREIDVLMETTAGPLYNIKIAVEAKDEKRPLDVGAVEKLIGKYLVPGGVQVNQVVLVSRNGFTQMARKRASEVGMKLLLLDETTQSDWTKLTCLNVSAKMPLRVNKVELVPPVPSKDGKDPLRDGRFRCPCHGTDCGSPLQWAQFFLVHQIQPNSQIIEAEAAKHGGFIGITKSHPMKNYVFDFAGERHSVDELRLTVNYGNASGIGSWSSYELKDGETSRTVDQLECTLGPTRIRAVFPEGKCSPKVILRLDMAVESEKGPSIDLPPIATSLRPEHLPPADVGAI